MDIQQGTRSSWPSSAACSPSSSTWSPSSPASTPSLTSATTSQRLTKPDITWYILWPSRWSVALPSSTTSTWSARTYSTSTATALCLSTRRLNKSLTFAASLSRCCLFIPIVLILLVLEGLGIGLDCQHSPCAPPTSCHSKVLRNLSEGTFPFLSLFLCRFPVVSLWQAIFHNMVKKTLTS